MLTSSIACAAACPRLPRAGILDPQPGSREQRPHAEARQLHPLPRKRQEAAAKGLRCGEVHAHA